MRIKRNVWLRHQTLPQKAIIHTKNPTLKMEPQALSTAEYSKFTTSNDEYAKTPSYLLYHIIGRAKTKKQKNENAQAAFSVENATLNWARLLTPLA